MQSDAQSNRESTFFLPVGLFLIIVQQILALKIVWSNDYLLILKLIFYLGNKLVEKSSIVES